jgi:8-oxo-dGTP pyrophosphatase MutT (NUDIX family)
MSNPTTPEVPTPRPSARVLVLDQRSHVLLFKAVTPDGVEIWFTPGGGLDEGETYESAALRELEEETGLTGVELGPWVWRRRHVWRYGGRLIESIERFFIVRTETFDVVSDGWEDLEAQYMLAHRWWSVPEILAATDLEFAPRRLGELLAPIVAGDLPDEPIDTGE